LYSYVDEHENQKDKGSVFFWVLILSCRYLC